MASDQEYAALGRALAAVIEEAVYQGVRRALAEQSGVMSMPGHDRVVSVADAAEYLKTSQSTVYELIRSSRLPAVRLGRQRALRVSLAALQAFISTQAGEASI